MLTYTDVCSVHSMDACVTMICTFNKNNIGLSHPLSIKPEMYMCVCAHVVGAA